MYDINTDKTMDIDIYVSNNFVVLEPYIISSNFIVSHNYYLTTNII